MLVERSEVSMHLSEMMEANYQNSQIQCQEREKEKRVLNMVEQSGNRSGDEWITSHALTTCVHKC